MSSRPDEYCVLIKWNAAHEDYITEYDARRLLVAGYNGALRCWCSGGGGGFANMSLSRPNEIATARSYVLAWLASACSSAQQETPEQAEER